MKYMGSKRAMLRNGLGELLVRKAKSKRRFVDLFCGSGAVAVYMASNSKIRVSAWDLQRYSAVLANAIITRNSAFNWERSWKFWHQRARLRLSSRLIPQPQKVTRVIVADVREWCRRRVRFPFTRAYGGHYFSPYQAVWLDILRQAVPTAQPARTIAIAALIRAASRCAAAPGHTAQPFQPTKTAKKHLLDAWKRDLVAQTKTAFQEIAKQCACSSGQAIVGDANEAAKKLRKGDLAFIDPPYSGVHYSRFYHVLESIARGRCGRVSGVGRYPSPKRRPWSRYSVPSEAKRALSELFETVSSRKVKTIVTFPVHKCSNGLSGRIVRNLARKYFRIEEQQVKSTFSSLGGIGQNGNGAAGRAARVFQKELILVLNPKKIGQRRELRRRSTKRSVKSRQR
jgi:adenine-specific DNA-methyltransferase